MYIAFWRNVLRANDLLSPFSSLFFSFRFSIYMPYCSTGILSFMDIIKHQFKGTSTVLVSERKRFYLCLDFTQVLTVLFILFYFCKADCIENVTKDVPRNKLYTLCIFQNLPLMNAWYMHFCHFPQFWTAVHLAATKCHIKQRLVFVPMVWGCMLCKRIYGIMFHRLFRCACRSQCYVSDWSLDY